MLSPRPFWSLHTHSKFSVNDALPEVHDIVRKADELGYPAIGLTDHGSVSGAVQLYRAARKVGIEPLPGIELYVVPDVEYAGRKDNLHLTVAAYSEAGYRNLTGLATLTSERYWYKPRVDFADFAQMAEDGRTEGLVVTTGCYFGVLPTIIRTQGDRAAVQAAQALAGWFPRVYVELQNHGIDEHHDEDDWTDDEMMDMVWDVAQQAGLPVIIARDSHYLNEEDKPLHDGLKRLMSWSEDGDDAIFPGGGYHMTDAEGLKEYFPPKMLEAGLAGLEDLSNAAYLRLPELENFSLKIPDVTLGDEDPQDIFEAKVMSTLDEAEKKDPATMAAIRQEFDVIRVGEMAPYLLLVDMVCEFMRNHPQPIRYAARGSAAGSMCNYKLKITQVHPLKLGLRFDRFLSHNRMKPPDVDLDVEHTRRDEVIAFLKSKWAVRSVGSHMKYSLWEEEEGDESKGSLRIRYFSNRNKKGLPKVDWRHVPEDDKSMLLSLADKKLISGYGTHAAGYIVAPNEEVVRQLPLAYIASSKKMVTAYGKKDVEILGFLKLDLLGLRTQTAIRIMSEESGIDFEDIPDRDKETFRKIGSGENVGVFQLEGWAMSQGCKQIKPRSINDIIAAQALFRPATMKSGATGDYRAHRSGALPLPQRHADIMTVTKETYGVLLYQEQVMDVMERLGMTPVELEEMLDAVKASNEYSEGAAVVIQEKLPRIHELATARGWGQVDINWLIEGLGAYADYSFNKAHAASYGVIAYRTAYMRVHHPLAFWLGMLVAYEGHDNLPKYVMEARRDGIRILPAHVNHSKLDYTIDRDRAMCIRRGITSVRGVGKVAGLEIVSKAPYTSLTDFGERVLPRRVSGAKGLALKKSPAESGGIVAALADIDALDGLEP